MALLDSLIRDVGVPTPVTSADRAFLARKLSSILASGKRDAGGRDFEAKTWRETHTPTQSGFVWVANPPIRELLSPANADHDAGSGLVYVGTSANVIVEYKGGYAELPADIYDAIISLMGQAWSQKSGTGISAAPGVTELQLYDVGTVKFAGSGTDAILGGYCETFKSYASPAMHFGTSTLRHAEVM